MKKIVHMCMTVFTDTMGYQENLLTKYHVKAGFSVTVITSMWQYDTNGKIVKTEKCDYINQDGVRVKRLPLKNGNNIMGKFRRFKGLTNVLIEEHPDILFIHGCQFIDLLKIVNYIKKYKVKQVYIDNHADFSNSATNWMSKNILHKVIWRYCAKKIEPYTKKFYGVLPARVDFLTDIYKLPKEKCELLVMGADDEIAEDARRNKNNIRKKYNIGNYDFLIVTGGKIDRWKEQTLFLEQVVKDIHDKNVKLLLFGSITDELKEKVLNLCDKRIVYVGWLSVKETYALIAAADLAVYPGRHSTLWEQTVGQGIPMLVKHWEGTHHVEIDGNVRFLYEDSYEEIFQRLKELLDDRKQYEKMRTAAENSKDKFLYSEGECKKVVMKLYITLLILLIVSMQIFQKRLLTSVTVWAGCYYCYFVIAPFLLNYQSEIIDQFAWAGLVSFYTGYVLISIIKGGFPTGCKKTVIALKSNQETLAVKRYGVTCDYVLAAVILLLFLTLGGDGLLTFFRGQLAAKDYLIKKEGIFAELYSFLIGLTGYMILYLFIKNNGKINRKFVIRIAVYLSVLFFFSFTRATLLLLLAALFLYGLRKMGTVKQILIMFMLVVFGVLLMIVMVYTRVYGVSVITELNTERILHNLSGSIDFTIVYMDFQREIDHGVHISPLVYLKPAFMIIPRMVWPDKPYTSAVQILNQIDPGAMARAYSTGFTILGEGYAIWGKNGIYIVPFIWSLVCTVLDEIYIRKIKNGTDNDFATCAYLIFTAYTVIQCHRQGTDAVMVTFIISLVWVWLCSKIRLPWIKTGFTFKIGGV